MTDTTPVIEIRDRDATPGSAVRRTDSSGLPNYMVTVAASIELEQAVCCGVAPFGGALMVLCVPTHDAKVISPQNYGRLLTLILAP